MKHGTARPVLKVKNIGEVLKRDNLRLNTHFIYNPNGEGFYIFGGEEITENDFDAILPALKLIPAKYKGENPNKKKNYIHDGKSY